MFSTFKRMSSQKKKYRAWKMKNMHNETFPANDFDFDCVTIGNGTYGDVRALTFNKEQKLRIGHYCSIASGVVFVVSAEHSLSYVSTYPFKVKMLMSQRYKAISKGDINVGSDVWIGQNSVILSGVSIGQGAVIGAGSIVTKDIEPYAIAVGVPAKVIKYRFENEIIEYMKTLDYSCLTREMIGKHLDALYREINGLDIQNIRQMFEWFPKNNGSVAK